MVLEPTVVADFVDVFERRPEVGAVIIPERSFGEGFFASCRVLEKSLYVGDADVEAPRAFRREVFDATGGWDETLTAAEDWDLADRTKALGVVDRIDSLIWHDEGRIQLHVNAYSKKQYYGRWVAEYLSRHPKAAHTWPGPVFSSKPAHWPSIRSRPRVWCCSKVLRRPVFCAECAGLRHDLAGGARHR